MNKSKSSVSQRIHLDDASIVLSRIYQKSTIDNVVLSWRLEQYEELQEDVMYFQFYEKNDLSCTLRILKRNCALYLCVAGRNIPANTRTEFLVMREPSLKSVTKEAEQIEVGVFAAEFPLKSYFGPDLNSLGDEGTLTVSFKYASDHYVTYRESDLEDKEVLCDFDGLGCDLKNMYFEALCSDFLIHVGEYTFKTHKFMLSARSLFFEDFFHRNKNAAEWKLEDYEYPGIFHEALVYIYSGELLEMDIECMLQLYYLACRLKVESLRERCHLHFKKHIDEDNVNNIASFAARADHAELKNIVFLFIRRNMPGVNIVDYFMKIQKENS